jgi:hypothetical protein
LLYGFSHFTNIMTQSFGETQMHHEDEFRQGDFRYTETLVTDRGEIDRFESETLIDLKIEVAMTRNPEDTDLTFTAVRVIDQDGQDADILSQKGGVVDPELVEMMAWEHIEADGTRELDYAYGRKPCEMKVGETTREPAEHLLPEASPSPDF